MNFYYSKIYNLCADEDWIIGWYQNKHKMSKSQAEAFYRENLQKEDIEDWKRCDVSNTIEEGFHDCGLYKYY